jgi:lysophospholipid acyltransferase (LPLAT)-like uncharacterized protein
MKEFLRTHKKQFAVRFLGRLIYCIMWMLRMTMRITIIGGEIPQAYHDHGEGMIGVFWHARLLLPIFGYKGKGVHVLISSHGDGEIIASVMSKFGQSTVRGSSSKGGKEALKEMMRLAKENRDILITPDGPRGPAEVVKGGVATLACLTGRPVVPMASSCSRGKRMASWDRFLLPYPFSRGVIVWGEPLSRLEGEEPEAFRQRIEAALKETTARADGYFSQ